MVGIGNADIRRRIGLNVGDNVVVNTAIVGIQTQLNLDVGIKCFKIGNRLLIYARLSDVGIVLGPEGQLVLLVFKGVRMKLIPCSTANFM